MDERLIETDVRFQLLDADRLVGLMDVPAGTARPNDHRGTPHPAVQPGLGTAGLRGNLDRQARRPQSRSREPNHRGIPFHRQRRVIPLQMELPGWARRAHPFPELALKTFDDPIDLLTRKCTQVKNPTPSFFGLLKEGHVPG